MLRVGLDCAKSRLWGARSRAWPLTSGNCQLVSGVVRLLYLMSASSPPTRSCGHRRPRSPTIEPARTGPDGRRERPDPGALRSPASRPPRERRRAPVRSGAFCDPRPPHPTAARRWCAPPPPTAATWNAPELFALQAFAERAQVRFERRRVVEEQARARRPNMAWAPRGRCLRRAGRRRSGRTMASSSPWPPAPVSIMRQQVAVVHLARQQGLAHGRRGAVRV